MSEHVVSGAERAPNPYVALHNTAQLCFADPYNPAILASQRELLGDIIAAVASRQSDANAGRAIERYGAVLDYLWFQPANAPLAEEVVFKYVPGGDVDDRWGQFRIGADMLSDQMFEDITDLLRPFGLQSLLRVRSANFEQNKNVLVGALQRCLAYTPAGSWLQEFAVDTASLPSRLTARERADREARNFSEVAHGVQQQHGVVTNALIRTSPGVTKDWVRRDMHLEEEPGSLRAPSMGLQTASRLTEFTNQALVSMLGARGAGVVRAEYTPESDELRLLGADGNVIARYETGDISQMMYGDVFDHGPSYGADDMSLELHTNALRAAYTDQVTEGQPRDVYANALDRVASSYLGSIGRAFGLASSSGVEDMLNLLKLPPEDTPYGEAIWHGEESAGGQGLIFDRILAYGARGGREDSGVDRLEQALRVQIGLGESAARPAALNARLERSIADLLGDLRRFMSLAEDAPDDAIFKTLSNWSQHDLVVWSLGSLYRALDELQAGTPLSSPVLRDLARALDHIQALRDLKTPSRRGDPQGYARQPHLLAALGRALEPVETLAQPFRQFPSDT